MSWLGLHRCGRSEVWMENNEDNTEQGHTIKSVRLAASSAQRDKASKYLIPVLSDTMDTPE